MKTRAWRLAPLTLALSALGCGGGGAGSGGQYHLLTSPATQATPVAASPNGDLVAGSFVTGATQTAVIWTSPTAYNTVSSGASVYTLAAVTDAGQAFASVSADGGVTSLPESYTAGGGWTELVRPAGVTSATVAGVSEDGTTVLGAASTGLYLVKDGVATALPDSSPASPVGAVLSGDGTVVYQASSLGITRRVGTGSPAVVIPPTASPTVAGASSTGGVIAGTIHVAGTAFTRGYRFASSGSDFQDLGTLGDDVSSEATGIDRAGTSIVGVSIAANGTTRAFLWTASKGLNRLSDYAGGAFSGLTNVRPTAISADSQTIVGYGTDGSGNRQAWRLRR